MNNLLEKNEELQMIALKEMKKVDMKLACKFASTFKFDLNKPEFSDMKYFQKEGALRFHISKSKAMELKKGKKTNYII